MPRRSPRLAHHGASSAAAAGQPRTVFLATLPVDLRNHILRQLALINVLAVYDLQRTSTLWRGSADEEFWRSMCESRYPQPLEVMRRAGSKLSYRNFFRQQACVALPTLHAEPFGEYTTHEALFSELQWTLEIVVGPYSWDPGDVLRSAYSQTKSFQAGAEICFGGEEGGEALGRLCTVDDFVETTEATCAAIWTRWTVRRTNGKATSLYDDMPTADADLNLMKEEMSAGKSATVSHISTVSDRRWYRDRQHGFAHVYPDSGLTLAIVDGWVVAQKAVLNFMLDTEAVLIHHDSKDEELILSFLNDHDWA